MELVSKHIESAEMRTYLEKQIPRLTPKLKAKLQAELIVRSRRPLAEKIQDIQHLSKTYPELLSVTQKLQKAYHALYALPSDSVLMMTKYCRDEGKEPIQQFSEVFHSMSDAVVFLKENALFDATETWNVLSRYDLQENHLKCQATYLMNDDGTVWKFCGMCDRDENFEENAILFRKTLSPPLPFQSGDIVTVDCRPFQRVYHALILNNWIPASDCCAPWCVYPASDGKFSARGFKHLCGDPEGISPVYRAEVFHGTLPENERILGELQKRIRQQPAFSDFIDSWFLTRESVDTDTIRRTLLKAEEK